LSFGCLVFKCFDPLFESLKPLLGRLRQGTYREQNGEQKKNSYLLEIVKFLDINEYDADKNRQSDRRA
jgi:hypothetical protein